MDKDEFNDMVGRLITKTEAARLLGISRITLYKWIKNHSFPVVKVGDMERIDINDVNEWIEEKKRNNE